MAVAKKGALASSKVETTIKTSALYPDPLVGIALDPQVHLC